MDIPSETGATGDQNHGVSISGPPPLRPPPPARRPPLDQVGPASPAGRTPAHRGRAATAAVQVAPSSSASWRSASWRQGAGCSGRELSAHQQLRLVGACEGAWAVFRSVCRPTNSERLSCGVVQHGRDAVADGHRLLARARPVRRSTASSHRSSLSQHMVHGSNPTSSATNAELSTPVLAATRSSLASCRARAPAQQLLCCPPCAARLSAAPPHFTALLRPLGQTVWEEIDLGRV